MHQLLSARSMVVAVSALLLAACESGGDQESTDIAISADSLTFSAAGPDEPTPDAQTITATFGNAIVHLGVVHTGSAVGNVVTEVGDGVAEIRIAPAAPASVGAGRFTGNIAVTGYSCADAACSTLAAGPTRTISVSYQVSPIVRTIAPYVGIAGESASALLRGGGFQQFEIESITFGTTEASEFTVRSDTEIEVTYPALPAGNYPVQIASPGHEGRIVSTATLTVIDAPAYAAGTLAYPTANPAIRQLLYDAERSAVIVASDAGGGSIVRYTNTGGVWSAPLSVPFNELQDIALTADGRQLLALSRTLLTPVDAASLAPGTAVEPPELQENTFLKNLAVGNDNNAVVTTGIDEIMTTAVYMYTVRTATLQNAAVGFALNNATPGASGNGARIVLMQGHPSQETDPVVVDYSASNNVFNATRLGLRQNQIPPVLDRAGTRIVLNGQRVYNANYGLLGTLPDSTVATVLSPDGTRAYTYDSKAGAVLTFDISEAADNEDEDDTSLPQVGSATPLAGDPGEGVRMAITPDGGTLFLAGSTQLVIQPTP